MCKQKNIKWPAGSSKGRAKNPTWLKITAALKNPEFMPKNVNLPLDKLQDAKKINPGAIAAAAGAITSIFASRSKKIEEMRRKKEEEKKKERRKCIRNAALIGAGGAVAGVAAGYFAARSLQLSDRYDDIDQDIYKKNPALSDYAPSPVPNVACKEYLPFDKDTEISTDGTTLLSRR